MCVRIWKPEKHNWQTGGSSVELTIVVTANNTWIYIYIYIYWLREREKERKTKNRKRKLLFQLWFAHIAPFRSQLINRFISYVLQVYFLFAYIFTKRKAKSRKTNALFLTVFHVFLMYESLWIAKIRCSTCKRVHFFLWLYVGVFTLYLKNDSSKSRLNSGYHDQKNIKVQSWVYI